MACCDAMFSATFILFFCFNQVGCSIYEALQDLVSPHIPIVYFIACLLFVCVCVSLFGMCSNANTGERREGAVNIHVYLDTCVYECVFVRVNVVRCVCVDNT